TRHNLLCLRGQIRLVEVEEDDECLHCRRRRWWWRRRRRRWRLVNAHRPVEIPAQAQHGRLDGLAVDIKGGCHAIQNEFMVRAFDALIAVVGLEFPTITERVGQAEDALPGEDGLGSKVMVAEGI